MLLEIDEATLGRLFPALILVDSAQRFTAIGPALRRQCPEIRIGDPLGDHFGWVGVEKDIDLADYASRGSSIQLRHANGTLILTGSVIAIGDGHFLALNIVPAGLFITDTDLTISDFGPSDPTVQALMLLSLQRTLLDEARTTAAELAKERQRSFDLLERVTRVSGYMAHDFNNHLSIIRLNGDRLLGDSTLTGQQRRLVEIMLETAARGSAVSSSLMTLAQQHSDSHVPLNVDGLIEAHRSFFNVLTGTKVTLRLELSAGEAIVLAPRTVLLNCLVNLLINARDAMPAGGEVMIATRVESAAIPGQGETSGDQPRPHLSIRFADTGLGMDEAVLSRAFEPFFSTKPHGSGVGLASVQDFAREMGGHASLESKVGVGTTVEIHLPIDHCEPGLAATGSMPASDAHGRSGARVMVVEDEPYALEALAEVIEAQGYVVTSASSAAQARTELQARPHDVVLTDVIMPEMSGLDLAQWVNRHSPRTHVILMSGFVPATEDMKPEWLYIRKPLDTGHLCNLLAAALLSGPKAPGSNVQGHVGG